MLQKKLIILLHQLEKVNWKQPYFELLRQIDRKYVAGFECALF